MAPVGQGRVESCGEEGESVDLVAADEMRRLLPLPLKISRAVANTEADQNNV